ncbi:helix-turn-helix protein [Krasilnikovia cinnamomea]|uniref:Helix-turn-helix protein n=1 Tax=Krasilnikovia cinnamomea TaxID=349313 RepID=A0A4Q7ZJJ2_9ACTN|nr:helix-turn-helix domain-containing protein [Krasilnikovia cinnamomea]RZU50674.1 helix-turn-helix protein [Krasilnikovia cinnamomea]
MGEASAAQGPYYRPAEVARLLRCSEWWIKEQARHRRIPFSWIGGSYLFTEEHIAAIVRLFEVKPGDDIPAVHRRGRADGASSTDDPGAVPIRLRARPPRRARRAERAAA